MLNVWPHVEGVEVSDRFCLVCRKVHPLRVPKFSAGQLVRLIQSDVGYHHKDRVGQTAVIEQVELSRMVHPCDEVEYRTSFGFGNVLESRLEAVDG